MIGRLTALGFVGGVTAAHGLADLPNVAWVCLAAMPAMAGCLAARRWRRRFWQPSGASPWSMARPFSTAPSASMITHATRIAWVWLAACGGFAWTVTLAQDRLADALAEVNVDRVTRVDLRIVGLPRLDPDRRRFEAEVLAARPEGMPRRIVVTWGGARVARPLCAAIGTGSPLSVVGAGAGLAHGVGDPAGARSLEPPCLRCRAACVCARDPGHRHRAWHPGAAG